MMQDETSPSTLFLQKSAVTISLSESTRAKMRRELGEAQNNGRDADNSRDDFRPGQNLFRSDDDGNTSHYKRIHHSKSE